MNESTFSANEPLPFSSKDWDRLRFVLQDSILVDTSLNKLAIDFGMKWPIRGPEETPRKYIGYSLEALADLPEFFGKENRLPILYSILTETQSMDDPFYSMADQFEEVAKQEDDTVKAFRELEIPPDFPIAFVNLSPGTRTLCSTEKITELHQLVDFSKRCAKSIHLVGDLHSLVNALLQGNRETLHQFLPLRKGQSGLFLAECLGQYTTQLSPPEAATLLQFYKRPTTRQAWAEARPLPKNQIPAFLEGIKEAVQQCFGFFPDQAQQLRHAVASGDSQSVRFFASIEDADVENLCIAMAMAALDRKPQSKSILGRFLS
ncbi:MAG: hypothetical protein GVY10_01250 [Verrucomicrobia bacterium]|jgi:hypothetical protein|nr:hypothetical protein [Verrucomicrobiota bacterium]